MRGQNHQAGAIHVHEGHHQIFGGSRVCGSGRLAAFVAIGDRGFVAVVAIGDDQLAVAHLVLDRGYDGRIGNLPDAMDHAVLIGEFDIWF